MSNIDHKSLEFLTPDRITTPPVPEPTRLQFGFHLRAVQRGETLPSPLCEPISSIGPRCHEIRLSARAGEYRLIFQISPRAIRILDVFKKTTQKTPRKVIDRCKRRLAANPEAPE